MDNQTKKIRENWIHAIGVFVVVVPMLAIATLAAR